MSTQATTLPLTDVTDEAGRSVPRFAIGHVAISAADVTALTGFYTRIGMRPVVDLGRMSIVELRGGTHLILQRGAPGQATLDLIVDDIDATHQLLTAAGAEATPIRRGNPHDTFSAADPEGNTLVIHSTHAIGPV